MPTSLFRRSCIAAALVLAGSVATAQSGAQSGAQSAAQPDPAAQPLTETHWRLAQLNGKEVTVPKEQRGTLELTEDGHRVTGFGGCNRLMGGYELEGSSLRFRKVASTMMACQDLLMNEEREFLIALSATETYRISGDTLKLLNAKDEVVASLLAVTDKQ